MQNYDFTYEHVSFFTNSDDIFVAQKISEKRFRKFIALLLKNLEKRCYVTAGVLPSSEPFPHTRVTHLWMTQADAKWWLSPRSTEKKGDALKVKYRFPLKRPGVGITTTNFANLSSATNEHKVLPQTGFLAEP